MVVCACLYCLGAVCISDRGWAEATDTPPTPPPPHLPPGVENLFYEGPLRVRVPVSMQLDADGAFSFDIPLPSAEGAIGEVRRLGLCGRRRR